MLCTKRLTTTNIVLTWKHVKTIKSQNIKIFRLWSPVISLGWNSFFLVLTAFELQITDLVQQPQPREFSACNLWHSDKERLIWSKPSVTCRHHSWPHSVPEFGLPFLFEPLYQLKEQDRYYRSYMSLLYCDQHHRAAICINIIIKYRKALMIMDCHLFRLINTLGQR